MAGIPNELSLLDLYNRIIDDENDYGAKVRLLYDLYKANESLPAGVTNNSDNPSYWPNTGLNLYNIVETYGLAQSFCTSGVIVNCASLNYKFQLMLVEKNNLHPEQNGKLFYRYSTTDENGLWVWSLWKHTATEVATQLLTPRKIKLEGDVLGEVSFDGSKDVTINTLINAVEGSSFLPINVKVAAKNYATKTYIKICTLPPSSSSTYDYASLRGHLGGWRTDSGKCYINITCSNRDIPKIYGLAIGTLGTAAEIYFYLTKSDKKMEAYLVLDGYADTCDMSVVGAQAVISNTATTIEPSGQLIWRSSLDCACITNKSMNIASDKTVINYASTFVKLTIPTNATVDGVTATYDDETWCNLAFGNTYAYTYMELSTHDSGTEPIQACQYLNGSVKNKAMILDEHGNTVFPNNVSADKIFNAVWNDYAEFFPRGEQTSPGDVICLDVAAKDEQYIKSSEGSMCVVGVHSDEFGHILGGDQPPAGADFIDYNLKNFIPVALAGRVHVNFVGVAIKGSPVVATDNGCARMYKADKDNPEKIFGYLLEADLSTDKRKLKIKIK